VQNLLVTGAGGSAGHNVCWSLRVSRDGKVTDLTGTDTDKTSLELNKWVDNAYVVPGADAPRYTTILNKVIRRWKIELVLPQPDPEVGRISKDRDKIESRLFMPDQQAVTTCLDKYEAILKWHRSGLRKRPILVADGGRSLESSIRGLNFPCWLRARHGAGGLMSYFARTWKEAYYWVMLSWEQGSRGDFVAEDFLPGRDFCFMSLWKEGRLVTSMARERLSWVGHRSFGSGGTSKLNKVVHSEQVNNKAIEAIRAVSSKPHGVFCVDLKEDHGGVPLPTEINCRFTTNVHYLTLASIRLGLPELNFPWLAARIGLGESIPPCRELNAVPSGIWFTKNTDMGFTMVQDDNWRAVPFT
jgi:carbamoyl-phosphate synthase large subunit